MPCKYVFYRFMCFYKSLGPLVRATEAQWHLGNIITEGRLNKLHISSRLIIRWGVGLLCSGNICAPCEQPEPGLTEPFWARLRRLKAGLQENSAGEPPCPIRPSHSSVLLQLLSSTSALTVSLSSVCFMPSTAMLSSLTLLVLLSLCTVVVLSLPLVSTC